MVNADDFGFTPDVNEGIVEAHREGILTAATLMANGGAFEDAVRCARENPSLDIGCHLVLVGGCSVASSRALPASIPRLLVALVRREIAVYEELRAQVERIVHAGLQPTHLDTHKHTHLAPPVLEAVARVGEEFGIRWIRRPFDFPLIAAQGVAPLWKRLTGKAMGSARRRFKRVLEKHACRATDHFAGFEITGRWRTAELVTLLQAIPEGSTELMCHPGRCREALRLAPTRLKESREEELKALTAPAVRETVTQAGIELTNYRRLG